VLEVVDGSPSEEQVEVVCIAPLVVVVGGTEASLVVVVRRFLVVGHRSSVVVCTEVVEVYVVVHMPSVGLVEVVCSLV